MFCALCCGVEWKVDSVDEVIWSVSLRKVVYLDEDIQEARSKSEIMYNVNGRYMDRERLACCCYFQFYTNEIARACHTLYNPSRQ